MSRTYRLEALGEPLSEVLHESDFRVDVEPQNSGATALIFAKRRGWICGTPWTGLIEIPMIPDDVPIDHREPIGFATLARDEDHSEQVSPGAPTS